MHPHSCLSHNHSPLSLAVPFPCPSFSPVCESDQRLNLQSIGLALHNEPSCYLTSFCVRENNNQHIICTCFYFFPVCSSFCRTSHTSTTPSLVSDIYMYAARVFVCQAPGDEYQELRVRRLLQEVPVSVSVTRLGAGKRENRESKDESGRSSSLTCDT